MPPVETCATVLSTVAYGETSKVARLATEGLGVVSVIAKGARRPRSRFGAALQVLSEGSASIIPSRHSDLHTLAAFDLIDLRAPLAASMDRFALASALGELMLRCTPAQGQPETYGFFRRSLDLIQAVPVDLIGVVGLRAVWGLIRELGFAPNLSACVRDGRPVSADRQAAFAAGLGGVLCGSCASGVETTLLEPADRRDLAAFIDGDADFPALDSRYLAAHRRLADRYIRHHVAEGAHLTALGFWADQAWVARSA